MNATNRALRPFAVVLAVGLIAIMLIPAVRAIRANQNALALTAGQSITLTCETGLGGQVQDVQALVTCAAPPQTATPVLVDGPQVTELRGIQDSAVITGVLKVEALVSGKEIAQVAFQLSGPKTAGNVEKSAPYAFFGDKDGQLIGWNTSQYPDGTYTLTATVTDRAGRSGSRSVQFTVANTRPAPPNSSPTAGPTAAPSAVPIIVAPTAPPAVAPPAPTPSSVGTLYLSTAEIAAIKAQIAAGKEPWKSAYDRLIADANKALNERPASVTANGGPQNGSEYFTEQPYCGWKRVDGKEPDCRDGRNNPRANRGDYEAAMAAGRNIRTLGLAYAFTGEAKYADQAVAHIRTWATDPQTRLNPAFTNSQSRIELSITMPGVFYGASMLNSYSGWPEAERQQFREWVARFVASGQTWQSKANFENWRTNFLAAGGAYLGDQAVLDLAFNGYRQNLVNQMDNQGRMTFELDRTKSLMYSLYAINAMIQTAEIARQWNVDLYNYAADGRSLKLALDYHAPFAAGKQRWPHQQISDLSEEDNVALYELAYAQWQEPAYKAVIDQFGRPMTEIRILGPVSLTHAERFALK